MMFTDKNQFPLITVCGVIFAATLTASPQEVRADRYSEWISVTCIQELNYFFVEHKTIRGGSYERLEDSTISGKNLSLHSGYKPSKGECRLRDGLLEWSVTPVEGITRGPCSGAYPGVSLSLNIGKKRIADDLTLGVPYCHQLPEFSGVEVLSYATNDLEVGLFGNWQGVASKNSKPQLPLTNLLESQFTPCETRSCDSQYGFGVKPNN